MTDIRIHRDAAFTELAGCLRPLLESQRHEALKSRWLPYLRERHIAAIAYRNRPRDSSSRAAGRFDDLLDRAAGRREIFYDEDPLSLHELVVAAPYDESAIFYFVRIYAIDIAAAHLAEMMGRPGR